MFVIELFCWCILSVVLSIALDCTGLLCLSPLINAFFPTLGILNPDFGWVHIAFKIPVYIQVHTLSLNTIVCLVYKPTLLCVRY